MKDIFTDDKYFVVIHDAQDRPEKAIYQPRSRSAQSTSSKAQADFTGIKKNFW